MLGRVAGVTGCDGVCILRLSIYVYWKTVLIYVDCYVQELYTASRFLLYGKVKLCCDAAIGRHDYAKLCLENVASCNCWMRGRADRQGRNFSFNVAGLWLNNNCYDISSTGESFALCRGPVTSKPRWTLEKRWKSVAAVSEIVSGDLGEIVGELETPCCRLDKGLVVGYQAFSRLIGTFLFQKLAIR